MEGGFDGFYTYFASDEVSYGSSRSNWPRLNSFAEDNNLIFIASVGPGLTHYANQSNKLENKHNEYDRLLVRI